MVVYRLVNVVPTVYYDSAFYYGSTYTLFFSLSHFGFFFFFFLIVVASDLGLFFVQSSLFNLKDNYYFQTWSEPSLLYFYTFFPNISK